MDCPVCDQEMEYFAADHGAGIQPPDDGGWYCGDCDLWQDLDDEADKADFQHDHGVDYE